MTRYRSVWLRSMASASLLGVCVAILVLSLGTIVLTFVFTAAVAMMVNAESFGAVDPATPGAIRTWLGSAALRVGFCGAGGVAFVALATVVPLLLVFLLLLVLATSPGTVAKARARLAARHESSSGPRPAQAHAWGTASAAADLTDRDLCRAWCSSFEMLQSTTDVEARAHIVALRQAYIDELDRRDPLALRTWLASGAGPMTSPDRYLSGPGTDRPPDR